jgi:ComF family protein
MRPNPETSRGAAPETQRSSPLEVLLGSLLETVLDAVFPPRCAGCELPGELLCGACRESLSLIEAAWACPRCAAPYGWLVCTECWDVDLGLDGAVAVGVLERPLSRSISIYKDAHETRLADVLGALLADAAQARWEEARIAEAVVPVPAASRAVRTRGFDHALLLAEAVARRLAVPCMPMLRHVRSADQRALSRTERLANMEGAFELAGPAGNTAPDRVPHVGDAPPDRVLLVDDVFTTGATLQAASTVLRSAGAREVRAGVLARAW